ncbi:membrane-spanning 4-domains subfamily A member 14-like isoform X2 [Macrotis lagotis]|uniref:membrane-spanning 4-domains subfamily A member 14-like isoform X2 n=1 Tax=Macrotis lagotis TaxID=92651 RepID=UPI003D696456
MLKPKPTEENSKMRQDSCHTGKLIISALPYKNQSFMPSLLRGEPRLLGVLQILIGLIIVTLGVLLFHSFTEIRLSKAHAPILYMTKYPYWAGICYTITGFITIAKTLSAQKSHISLFLDGLCVLVATCGIGLFLYTLSEDDFFRCDPSLSKGICLMGKVFLHGILSLFLILTIVQMSIAATLLAFQCIGTRKNLANELS